MYDCTADYVRLPISSVKNVRELGGYPTKDGGMTQWHRVLRAGDMTELSEADRSFLLGYGLTTVIDLRSADETAARPNPLAEDSRIEYYQLPYIAGDLTAIDFTMADAMTLPKLYVQMAEMAKRSVRDVFQIIARAKGTVLFHCTAGKDRTGVTAALLLLFAGVSMEDVISNYQVSQTYFASAATTLTPMPEEASSYLFASEASYIRYFLDYILERYGSAESYLSHIGVSREEMQMLRDKLTKKRIE